MAHGRDTLRDAKRGLRFAPQGEVAFFTFHHLLDFLFKHFQHALGDNKSAENIDRR